MEVRKLELDDQPLHWMKYNCHLKVQGRAADTSIIISSILYSKNVYFVYIYTVISLFTDTIHHSDCSFFICLTTKLSRAEKNVATLYS